MSEKIIRSDVKEIVDGMRDKLLEHCDSVRIFVSRHDGNSDGTSGYTTGGGNYFAQMGQVNEWLVRQQTSVEDEEDED